MNEDRKKSDPSVHEHSPPDATPDKYVARLESEVEFLRGQITVKDMQLGKLPFCH